MRINTVTKKIVMLISIIGVIVMIIINIFFPSVFYYVMKPHLINQISSVVTANALKQSYIWQNNIVLRGLEQSKKLESLVYDYYYSNNDKQQTADEITSFLPVTEVGVRTDQTDNQVDHGYIVYTSYTLMFTDRGDVFLDKKTADVASLLIESDWYQNFDYDVDFFAHLPEIIDKNNPDNNIFCMVSGFQLGDISCFGINIVRAKDILITFDGFEDFNINDYIIYCKGNTIYSNLTGDTQINLAEFPGYMFEGGQYQTQIWEDGTETNFMVLCTYKKEDYRVAVKVTKEVFLEPYQDVFTFFRVLFGGVIVLLLVLFVITLKRYLNRLTKLDRKMNRVRKGDYDVVVNDNSTDEIGNLANTFNMMLDRIKTDMINEEKMQYSLMVSAIDPHYLYNTMNTVTALAEMGKNEDVVVVNKALIATLKDRLKMKNYKTFDTVKVELEAIRQYMIIQDYLCHQKITYSFDVDEDDLHMMIPKNIIQPLVENSIKHGILCNEDENGNPIQGNIKVSVKWHDEKIHIEVVDNGAGIDAQTLERYMNLENAKKMILNDNMEHIGIYNVQMRLNYLYKGKYEFLAESTVGKTTKIKIILPYRSNPDTDA